MDTDGKILKVSAILVGLIFISCWMTHIHTFNATVEYIESRTVYTHVGIYETISPPSKGSLIFGGVGTIEGDEKTIYTIKDPVGYAQIRDIEGNTA